MSSITIIRLLKRKRKEDARKKEGEEEGEQERHFKIAK